MAAARSSLAGCLMRTMTAPALSLLVPACIVPATYRLRATRAASALYGFRSSRSPRPARFHVRLSLKAASPRSRGEEYRSVRRTGLYTFKDSFGHRTRPSSTARQAAETLEFCGKCRDSAIFRLFPSRWAADELGIEDRVRKSTR